MPNVLLFIEANTTGTGMLALHKAAQLGLKPVLVANRPGRYAGLEGTPARILTCDTSSFAATAQAIEAEVGSAAICGITTTSEFYLELTAQLAEQYGAPGNPLLAMRTCRNKALTRRSLAWAGVYQPRFAIVRNQDDLGAALTSIGLPCVIKPVDDTGSNMVRLCTTATCAAEHMRQILDTETNVRGQPTSRTALVEEYLDAPEYSVEMFTWQGETHYIGITEKHLTGAPFFVEHRHLFPAHLAEESAAQIVTAVLRALRAVGITTGPTHTEVKLTPRGCAIIEINARLAGGMIPELVRHATGLDLLEQQIRAATGQIPELEAPARRCAGIQFIVAPRAGTFSAVDGVEAAQHMDGVEQITITARAGAAVVPPRSAYDRLGFVIAAGSTYIAAAQRLRQAAARLQLVLT